ncbi:MAG: Ig-like domain-containing protein [Gemmataceae bacterium]
MTRQSRPTRARLRVEGLEGREVPANIVSLQNFDALTSGLPAGWAQWASTSPANAFAASTALPFSGPGGLAATSVSNVSSRAWLDTPQTADYGSQAAVYLNSLAQTEVIARGSNLGTTTPTYYAARITRGLEVQLVRVVNGQATVLGSVRSTSYVSNKWVTVALVPSGNQLRVEVFDPATGKYLSAVGTWQDAPSYALTVGDTTIAAGGRVGVGRVAGYAGTINLDDFAIVNDAAPAAPAAVVTRENFETTANGALPAGWQQWSSDGVSAFGVVAANAISGARVLAATGATTGGAIASPDLTFAADQTATITVFANGLTPTGVIVRGTNLADAASYYAATVTRGGGVTLYRVAGNRAMVLGVIPTDSKASLWLKVSLVAEGSRLRVRVVRIDNGQYLTSTGRWTVAVSDAIDVRDSVVTGGGRAGVVRFPGNDGPVNLDDFEVTTATASDPVAPTVTLTAPAAGATLSGTVTVTADASDNLAVTRVEFYLGSTLVATDTAAPHVWNFDTRTVADGSATITVKAYDAAGNVGTVTRAVTIRNSSVGTTPAPFSLPTVPRHYSHIRVAELAWFGTPFTSFEQGLLQNSVDLVLPNDAYQAQIAAVAPNTPQLLYTNVSNLYQNLLSDWLTYADQAGYDREAAFYHVPAATPFQGGSPGAQPVNWLWDVRRDSTSLVSQARSTVTSGDVTFGTAGQSLYMGFTDRFRELNFDLQQGGTTAWSGAFEYASAVDAAGNPTEWKALTIASDGTNGMRQSGRVIFDPPADWKTANVGAGTRYFYVRVRTITGGTNQVPVARSIFGRDYVGATYVGQTAYGTIPAFDSAADVNGDGYLSDAEFANRATGKDARFRYESRLFYPYYGQMRFVTNPAGVGFNAWAADYHSRLLDANPLAAGVHIDNSNGKPPTAGIATIESISTYTADYAATILAVGQAIQPKWMSVNTAGGNTTTDAVVRNVQASFEEFAIRPLQASTVAFEDLAAQVKRRQALTNPSSYIILDSLLTSNTAGIGGPTDSRALVGALAYYYLIGNPDTTFFMLSGGNEPSTSWTRHWTDAINYNVGRPQGDFSLFATGADPANASLTYKVYGRSYDNALVLYKPLSYKSGVGTGTVLDDTATVHNLNGTYRLLRADGTLGDPTTTVSLRNGEGAILIRA